MIVDKVRAVVGRWAGGEPGRSATVLPGVQCAPEHRSIV
jgi:hypothetical protein